MTTKEAPAGALGPTAATVFPGGGEMAARCRDFDWGTTPLGPVAGWSQSLRTTVGIVLGSRNPMFLWWGPELIQIYNDAYRPSFGASGRHPRALGMRGRECWTDIWEIIGPQIDAVMTRGESTWHEDALVPIERNGRIEDVWWTYSYSPVYDDDGRIGGTLVVCLETTNRVLAARERERLLADTARAERRAARVLERVSDEHLTMDAHFRILTLNDAAERALGVPRETLVGRTHWEAFPASVGTVVEREYRRVVEERVEAHLTHHYVGEGYDRHLEIDAYPTDEGGVALFWRDISDRVRAAEALELERARLAQVFQRAPSFIVAFRGPDQVYEFVNEAYYQLVGHREILGKPLLEAIPEIRDQGFDELLERVRTTGEPWVGRESPVLLQRTPGAPLETRYLNMVFQALVEADGTRSGVVAHGSDVTEQVLARREVERVLAESERARAEAEAARAEAEAANRAKAEFLAVMSHELRTPLNAIGGYAELIEMGIRGPVTPQQGEDLRRIQTSQRHLLGLINEVLNYAKLETGTVQYVVSDVPVREALAAAASLVAPQARAKGLTLTVADCPPALAVRADVEKLRQILVNLLSNAVKFTDAGGRVDVSSYATEAQVILRVRDTGIGIPADKIEAIFDPFVQVRSDLTRPHEGTGLGLAISRDLARGMGGDLTAESRVGAGSTFTLTLPRAAS